MNARDCHEEYARNNSRRVIAGVALSYQYTANTQKCEIEHTLDDRASGNFSNSSSKSMRQIKLYTMKYANACIDTCDTNAT